MNELELEWDPEKAARVAREHGVTFDEASTVFLDPLAATSHDKQHSDCEDRYVTIGTTSAARLVVVAHTDRGARMRVITARLATASEKRAYEQAEDPRPRHL
ncbi:MAG: BrnT family toxin [Chloroflexota bacterium]